MSRRATAAAGAAALLAIALPALPAFAATGSTATLDGADTDVLPGAGQTFDIAVKNTDTSTPVLGGGTSINAVRVILPSTIGITTATPAPVAGWTVRKTSQSGLERYDFTTTGAGIAPGATMSFPLPANVARPTVADRSGAFQVASSVDAGNTYSTSTGSLGTTVHTLAVRSVAVVDQTVNGVAQHVADGNGTAGQAILSKVTVVNYARNPQAVTPLVVSNGNDTVTPATTATVPGTGTGETPVAQSFDVPITLGAVTADTVRTFTASATAGSPKASDTRSSGPLTAVLPYTDQAAPTLSLTSGTFKPTDVQRGLSYTYTVDSTKTGTPTLQLTSGAVTFKNAGGAAAPVSLAGTPVAFIAGGDGKTLSFGPNAFDASVLDGSYDAAFSFAAVDGNGFVPAPASLARTLTNALNVDNVAPTVTANVTLPADKDGDKTTAARNYSAADGNAITVSGTVNDAKALLGGVTLECATTTRTLTPSSAPTVTVSGSQQTYSATFQPDFGTCGAFKATASFRDLAGNVGQAFSANLIEVDNTVPTLAGLKGAVGRYDGVDAAKSAIMVNIGDNTTNSTGTTSGVIGGCDPRAWSVDGQLLVQAVYVLEGGSFRDCTTGATNPRGSTRPANNTRYLKLTSDIARNSTVPQPTISYDPANRGVVADPLKDAAGNYELKGAQDTLNKLVPSAPTLVSVTRNAGKEIAYNDGSAYYTRFAGNDLVVTVSGALDGDTLQLVKADGSTTSVSTAGGSGTIAVPVAATEGAAQRYNLRFLSGNGVYGDLTPLSVVFDKTLPAGAGTVKNADGTVAVTLTEPVLGDNKAINWNVWEKATDESGAPVRAYRNVNSVTGAGKVRTVSADLTSATYGGALYQYLDGAQYQDYAGNQLAPTSDITAG